MDVVKLQGLVAAYALTSDHGFMIINDDSIIEFANYAFADLFGFDCAQDCVGFDLNHLIPVHTRHPHGKSMTPWAGEGTTSKISLAGAVPALKENGDEFKVFVHDRTFFRMGDGLYGAAFVKPAE